MKKVLCMLLFSVWLFPVCASAATIHFNDNTIFMPTWESSDAKDNYKDSIGMPDFHGGKLTLKDNKLTGVSFDYFMQAGQMGDLFIDKDNNGYFDYVLNNETERIFKFADNVLSSKRGDNDSLYQLSRPTSHYPSDHRDDHFVALNLYAVSRLLDPDKVELLGTFDDIDTKKPGHMSSYIFKNFSTHGLEVDGEFSLAFSSMCANDVISTTAVPLPGTFVLMACGICGLVGVRRKTMEK